MKRGGGVGKTITVAVAMVRSATLLLGLILASMEMSTVIKKVDLTQVTGQGLID